jgi:hypothetical protein
MSCVLVGASTGSFVRYAFGEAADRPNADHRFGTGEQCFIVSGKASVERRAIEIISLARQLGVPLRKCPNLRMIMVIAQ